MKRLFVTLSIIFLVTVLGLGSYIAQGMPLPEPSGNYAVGQSPWHIVDDSRLDVFSDDPTDYRQWMLSLYYPAYLNDVDAYRTAYVPDEWKAGLARSAGLPAIFFDLYRNHSVIDAPIADSGAQYPVLIFAPGISTLTASYTALLEDLASRGYIIVALWVPYSTPAVTYPDGSVAYAHAQAQPVVSNDFEVMQTDALRISEIWQADIVRTLDELPTINQEHPILAGHLDLNRIGGAGHSFGGATMLSVATYDDRLSAVANMDGTIGIVPIKDESDVAYLFFGLPENTVELDDASLAQAGLTREDYDTLRTRITAAHDNLLSYISVTYEIRIDGLQHASFSTDLIAMQRLLPFFITDGLVGNLSTEEVVAIVGDNIHGFFDQFLRAGDAEFPVSRGEMTIESYRLH